VELRLISHQNSLQRLPELLREWKAWKAGLIDVLKNGPSKDRKFLRWVLIRVYVPSVGDPLVREVLEGGELEVLPESPL